MFRETIKAVSCSTVREFSREPASIALAPGMMLTNSIIILFAFSSFPQIRTSHSTLRERSLNSSALTLLKAETTATPLGTMLAANSPADPTKRPSPPAAYSCFKRNGHVDQDLARSQRGSNTLEGVAECPEGHSYNDYLCL